MKANKSILQVLSDVFNSPVYISEVANSAMMGAAYQAKHGLLRNESNFDEITRCLPEPTLVCRPYNDAETIYKSMVVRYRKIVEKIKNKTSTKQTV